jgi:GNAT superfamily N-acetyltransferase
MNNTACTVATNLRIVPGTRADYEPLARFHYRCSLPAACARIFVLKGTFRDAARLSVVGVIVYSMPALGCELRNVALGGLLAGLSRRTRAAVINAGIRTISRVVIEPRFRGIGLAARLVRETMPEMNVPFVEALAVMGRVNPFFEKAGMSPCSAPPSRKHARMIETLAAAGIAGIDLIDPRRTHAKLDALAAADSRHARLIARHITGFLQCYGKRRLMPHGLERTRFLLTKLTPRPIYYLWKKKGHSVL